MPFVQPTGESSPPMPETEATVWDVAAKNITPATHENMAQRAGVLHALLLLGIDPDMPFVELRAALAVRGT